MYLCLAVKRIPVPRVPKNWWEQNGVGMEGIQMEAWESEHMEGGVGGHTGQRRRCTKLVGG